MSDKLFNEFGGVSSKQWKQQIQFELKGADYNDLVWESPEGIKVKPFYHRDDQTPTMGGSASGGFSICQEIYVYDVEKSAKRVIDSVSRGAEEIAFVIPNADVDLAQLTDGLPDNVPVYLHLKFLSEDFLRVNEKLCSDRTFYLVVDPIHQLVSKGNWFAAASDLQVMAALSRLTGYQSTLSVDGRIYHNSGANSVQQVAYVLAHLAEYLNVSGASEKPVVFQMSVGSNYFFEIAKLRALRILFNLIAAEFGHTGGCRLVASPGKRNKTLYDYNVNMLRTTTESMSAILGGADTVCNLPYDAIYHKSNEFGERIARNQLLILKNESYFDKATNAADGSYYIESLTSQIAEKSLALFKEIEVAGGFLKQLSEGKIQKKIAESAAKEQELFDSGKEVLVGTNKYLNKNDRMKDDLELYPFVKVKTRKTSIAPVIERRLAEKHEQERLTAEEQPANNNL